MTPREEAGEDLLMGNGGCITSMARFTTCGVEVGIIVTKGTKIYHFLLNANTDLLAAVLATSYRVAEIVGCLLLYQAFFLNFLLNGRILLSLKKQTNKKNLKIAT